MAVSISNDVLSTVIKKIHDKAQYGLFKSTPFLSYAQKAGGILDQSGGYALRIPIEVGEQSVTTQLEDGWEELDLSHGNTFQFAEYNWGAAARPITISEVELSDASGEDAVIDLIAAYHKSALNSIMVQMNKQIIIGGQPGMSNFGTLNGTQTGGVATGFLEDRAPGSQERSMGGLLKSDYPNVPGLNNQFGDFKAAFATTGLAALREARTNASLYAPSGRPCWDLLLLHPTVLALFENQLQSYIRYIDASDVDAGKVTAVWEGAPVVADPAFLGQTAGTNGYISGYGLNFEGIKMAFCKGWKFEQDGFVPMQSQLASQARLKMRGTLVGLNLSQQAVFMGDLT